MKHSIDSTQSIMRILLIITVFVSVMLSNNTYTSESATPQTSHLWAQTPSIVRLVQQYYPTCTHTMRKSNTAGKGFLLLGVLGMTGLTWLSIAQGWSSRVTFALGADAFLLCFGIAALGLYIIEKQKKDVVSQSHSNVQSV